MKIQLMIIVCLFLNAAPAFAMLVTNKPVEVCRQNCIRTASGRDECTRARILTASSLEHLDVIYQQVCQLLRKSFLEDIKAEEAEVKEGADTDINLLLANDLFLTQEKTRSIVSQFARRLQNINNLYNFRKGQLALQQVVNAQNGQNASAASGGAAAS